GEAKIKFKLDLAKRKHNSSAQIAESAASIVSTINPAHNAPKALDIEVNGQKYHVKISYPGENNTAVNTDIDPTNTETPSVTVSEYDSKFVLAPLEGKFFLTKETSEKGIKVGDQIQKGETVAYVEAMKVINAITADDSGTIAEIIVNHGDEIEEDDQLIRII
ncbi:MAG: oxaloacetate decarboxylase, partial [Saprospiraceae bacterium]|nr:oxaloacetate decarboxylase [Saprospiraceae bacterium]